MQTKIHPKTRGKETDILRQRPELKFDMINL